MIFEFVKPVLRLYRFAGRQWWLHGPRLHVEITPVRRREVVQYHQQLYTELSAVPGVECVFVVPHLYRVVIHLKDPIPLTGIVSGNESGMSPVTGSMWGPGIIQDLVEQVDVISDCFAEATDISPGHRFERPADDEAEDRVMAEVATDSISILLALMLKSLGRTANSVEADLTRLITLVDNTPRLKNAISKRLGTRGADIAIGILNSLTQGISGGAISPIIDLFVQQYRLEEVRSQRELWYTVEKRTFPEKYFHEAGRFIGVLRPERPTDISEGPLEGYANSALQTSLGAFASRIADGADLGHSMGPLIGAMPKPALIARDVFCARIAARLAERGTMLLKPNRIRLLDRVDALVVSQDQLGEERLQMGSLVILAEAQRDEVRSAMRLLYDPEDPLKRQNSEGWCLQPIDEFTGVLSPSARAEFKQLSGVNVTVLVISQDQDAQALIQLRPTPSQAARALIRTARDAAMTVHIVAEDPEDALPFQPSEIWSPHNADEELRDLQREGHVVLCVADGNDSYLPYADIALLLAHGDEPVNRAVDMVTWNGLEDAAFLIKCCEAAKRVVGQGIQLSGISAFIASANMSRGGQQVDYRYVTGAVNGAASVSLASAVMAANRVEAPPDASEKAEIPWHSMPHDQVLAMLGTDEHKGLSMREAAKRYVPPPKPKSDLNQFIDAVRDEISNPLTPVLAGGAGVSASVGSVTDGGIVAAVLGVGGVLGGWQRYSSTKAIRALRETETIRVRVVRDGQARVVPSDQVVCGDIMLVRAGELIAADARILEARYAEVDESSLTGESLPVGKASIRSFSVQLGDRYSMLFSGTAMVSGEAIAVVVAIGQNTEMARSIRASAAEGRATGVDARLEELTQMTIPTALVSAGLLMGTGVLRGVQVRELLEASVNLAVASVPEGLPLLATSAELASASRLSKRGIMVRNPKAMEALGRLDTLCLDKTGTLTVGKLSFKGIICAEDLLQEDSSTALATVGGETLLQRVMISLNAMVGGDSPHGYELLQAARNATPQGNDPDEFAHRTDYALVAASRTLGISRQQHWVIEEIPFRSEHMYHATLVNNPETGQATLCLKGAPEVTIARSTHYRGGELTDAQRQALTRRVDQLGAEGYRVIAVADAPASGLALEDDNVQGLRILGFFCLEDPLRKESAPTLKLLIAAGVQPIMITGDHAVTATRIASELGLGSGQSVLQGGEIDSLDDDALAERLTHTSVVARAAPAHKLRLVRVFQQMGRVVGMTGDGGNDAPAIRFADVGIALGKEATQAARDASDLVVLDASLKSIGSAIAEGRALWGSVRDASSLLVGGNMGEIGFMTLGGVASGAAPLNARQLMMLNLFTDVAPALTIAQGSSRQRDEDAILSDGPESALGQQLTDDIVWRGLVTGSSAGMSYAISRALMRDPQVSSTTSLVSLVGTQLGQTLLTGDTRDLKVVASSVLSAAGLLAIVQTPALSSRVGSTPLTPVDLGIAIGTSVVSSVASAVVPRERRQGFLSLPKSLKKKAGDFLDFLIEQT